MSQRLSKGQGEDLGGTQIRSRFEKREGRQIGSHLQQSVMAAGYDPDFRNRPEIASMRRRAADFRASAGSETLEQTAKRLRRERG